MDPLYEFALAVKAITRELDRITNEAMRPLGLTGPQADALVVIGQSEPISLKELGGLLIAEAGHPSRLVDRLVDAGLVARATGGDDRRRIELSLTRRGRRLADRALATREGIIALARDRLRGPDVGPALELLRELVRETSYSELFERRRELLAGERG